MAVRNIRKQLAGVEDLLLGKGKQDQERSAGIVSITKIDIPAIVETIAELSLVDINKYTTAIVKDLDRGGTFIYDSIKVAENNQGTIFNGWVRQYNGAVNVKWFGAKGDGINDDTVSIQKAIDFGKSVFIDIGTYKITGSIDLSQNIFSISGVKGKSIIMGSGGGSIFGYFRVMQQYYADFGIIEGITFDSDDYTKSRWAIYSPSDVYLSHCKISECNFNGRLTGGIIANLIACHVYRCYFGVYFAGAGNNLKAIQSIGSVSSMATSNINIIEQCEFSNCGSPQAIVEFQTGYKVLFRDCIFEQLTPSLCVILLTGIEYPKIEGCWFENAQGMSERGKSVILTRQDSNGIMCEVLTVDDCLFHTYSNIPEGLFNFADSQRKVINFTKNFLINLESPIIVGGNSTAKFVSSFGNSATVGSGGDITGLQYNSPAKFDIGVATTSIKFPAIQEPSPNANTLDDYEEGEWNPTDISGASLVLRSTGKYTKIGNVVTFNAVITYPTTISTLGAKISTPPFTPIIEAPVSVTTNLGSPTQGLINGLDISLYKAGTFTYQTNANASGLVVYVSGLYITAT